MQDEVKVSQADRVALGAIDDALGFLMDNEREIVLAALARHRHQAERETLARMEPVAWMYVRKVDAWPTAPNILSNERWPANDPARPFWNELALYALPPAPEAGQ